MADGERRFDPSRHIISLKGKDYLEVKWRLVWLRDVYPHSKVNTEVHSITANAAVFKATVTAIDADGVVRGEATGYGSETPGDFGDFIEKAETKAIGRALAALGFGTQFSAHEFAGELDNEQRPRPVDAPVQRNNGQPRPTNVRQFNNGPQQRPANGQGTTNRGNGQGQGQGDPNRPASPKQVQYVSDLLGRQGIDPNDYDWDGLTAGEASAFIETLRDGRIPQEFLRDGSIANVAQAQGGPAADPYADMNDIPF